MKRKSVLLLTAALVVAMLFALASCDSNNSNTPSTSTRDPSSSARDKLICGITLYEPMNYKDNSDNWTGFDTEFALLVGDKLDMDVEFQLIEWSNKFFELNSGAITCIWNGFTANADESDGTPRVDLCDMTYSYMLNQQCVVIKADRAGEFSSAASLTGMSAAVESGSAGETAAKELVGSGGETF